MQSRRFDEAFEIYAQLVRQFPQCGAEYGRAAAHAGDFEMAVRVWEEARRFEPGNVDRVLFIASEYARIGLHARSRVLFCEAAKSQPRNMDAQIKAAWLLSRTNGVDEARPAVDRCLALDPREPQALYLAAHLAAREDNLDFAERQLRDLLAASTPPHVRYACHSELAHILDRTHRFDEAMAEFETGKSLARQNCATDPGRRMFLERQRRELELVKSLPRNVLQDWARAFPSQARAAAPPVAFLTGSARSGTTLLERVLDAHASICAFDEPQAFQKIQLQVDVAAPHIAIDKLNLLRCRYVRNLAADLHGVGEDKVLLDKNPSCTAWLPALLRVFPELRVIVGLRDPRDVIVSIYFQDHPNTNHLTFAELARRYSEVMDAWLAVREWDGLNWLETRYENLVADLPAEGRRVTEFLGLTWQDSQARYFELNRDKPVLSTNYRDVTQPAYKRAVGRWKVYEKYLTEILPLLEPYCKKFGYAC